MFGSEYPSLRVNPYHVNIPMDATASNPSNPDFFVNITHTDDVKTLVIVKGVDDLASGPWTFQGKACTLIGEPENLEEHLGMVRTRYTCHCDDKCDVIVQVRGTSNSNVDNNRLCTINVYDESE